MSHPYAPACRLILLSILLLIPLLGGGACQSQPDANPRAAVLVAPLDAQQLGYRTQWLASVAIPPSGRLAWIARAQGQIVTCDFPDNILTAVDARTGSLRWRSQVGQPGDTLYLPAVHEGKLIVCDATNAYALALDDGRMLYIHELRGVVRSAPLLMGDTLIAGHSTGRVQALNIESGVAQWGYSFPAAIKAPPVAVSGERVLLADELGNYALFDRYLGSLQWRGRAFDRITAPAVCDTATAYLPSEDNALYAVSLRNGSDRWIYRTDRPLDLPPTLIDDTLYLPVPHRGLIALHTDTGKERWALPALAQPLLHRDGRVILRESHTLTARDLRSGEVLLSVPTLPTADAILIDDMPLLISPRGDLQLLAPTR